MHYVYILKSKKDKKIYAGSTDNLRRRFSEHTGGSVKSTKYRRPLIICFYEAFLKKEDATRRERYFKTTKGKSTLKVMLRESLKE